jgi:hypothetical protein
MSYAYQRASVLGCETQGRLQENWSLFWQENPKIRKGVHQRFFKKIKENQLSQSCVIFGSGGMAPAGKHVGCM